MGKSSSRSFDAAALRLRAEELARRKRGTTLGEMEQLPLLAALEVLEELRVHQIELELQNEEMHRAQVELQASRERYFDLYDLAPVGYLTISDSGLILESNLKAAALLGLPRATLASQPISRFIVGEAQDDFYLHQKHLLETGRAQAWDLQLLRQGEGSFWVHMEATSSADAKGESTSRLIFSDITAQKLAETKILESQDFNISVLDSLAELIAVVDPEGTIVAVNKAWRQFREENGASALNPIGSKYLASILPAGGDPKDESVVVALGGIEAVLAGTRSEFQLEYPCHAQGVRRWFSMMVTPMSGSQRGAVITHLDISDRREVEERLRNHRWELESILEGTGVGTWMWNVQTGETIFNERWAEIVGYSLAELTPLSIKTWDTLAHSGDLQRFNELLERHFAGESPHFDLDCRMRHKDGSWRWIHDRGRVVSRTADGKPLMMFGTHSDITARKQMEEHLLSLEQLSARGQMAAYLAHEINNPLTGIKNAFHLLEEAIPPDHPRKSYANLIRRETDRISNIVRTVYTLYRPYPAENKLVLLMQVFQDLGSLLEATLRSHEVKLSLKAEPPDLAVELKEGLLRQVLFNLIQNAVEASPPGTCVTVAVSLEQQLVILTVADQGSGIEPENAERIFLAGFTTKLDKEMSGLGLGLSNCRNLIESMAGTLDHYSNPDGQGTVFRVRLASSSNTDRA